MTEKMVNLHIYFVDKSEKIIRVPDSTFQRLLSEDPIVYLNVWEGDRCVHSINMSTVRWIEGTPDV